MINLRYTKDPNILKPRPWDEFLADFEEDGSISENQFTLHHVATLARYGEPNAMQKIKLNHLLIEHGFLPESERFDIEWDMSDIEDTINYLNNKQRG